ASAIVAARAGSPRRTVTAVMRAALSAWSASRTWRVPSSRTTAQVSLTRSGTSRVRRRATAPTASTTSASTPTVPRSSLLRMEGVVERDARPRPGECLDGDGHGVAPQEQVGQARQLAGGDDRGRGGGVSGGRLDRHLGAGGDVQAGLDDAVVTEGDPDPAVGAEQA